MNVLIPNVGRRGYLVRYLKNTAGFAGKVFVSDCDNTASGLYGDNDGAFILPKPADNEQKYIESLLELCQNQDIRVIIPVIDPEIVILSRYRERFQKSGIFVAVSTSDVLEICYNKLKMNAFLKANGFCYPQTFQSLDQFVKAFNAQKISFPVVLKPILGSGSVETYIIRGMEEVTALFHDGMMIQDFIDGQEFGIDIFNAPAGNPIRCVVKKKISMRSGETDKSRTVNHESIQQTALRLAERLGHICNLDFDIIEKDDKLFIIDLNPRFGGGYPATHEAGVNLLELVLKTASKEKLKPEFNNYKTNLFVLKEIGIVSTESVII